MRVLVVEDDRLQAESIEIALKRNFQSVGVEIISTESEFCSRLETLREDPPDVVLIDVMLRWADPAPDMPPPPTEIAQEGFFRGGMRCLRRLLETPETREIPVVVHSVLQRDDIESEIAAMPRHVLFLQKDSDELRLVREIRSLLQGLPEGVVKGRGWRQRLWESVEAKPGWFGFSVDLKQLLCRRAD